MAALAEDAQFHHAGETLRHLLLLALLGLLQLIPAVAHFADAEDMILKIEGKAGAVAMIVDRLLVGVVDTDGEAQTVGQLVSADRAPLHERRGGETGVAARHVGGRSVDAAVNVVGVDIGGEEVFLGGQPADLELQLVVEKLLLKIELRQPRFLASENLLNRKKVADLTLGQVLTGRPGTADVEAEAGGADQLLKVEVEAEVHAPGVVPAIATAGVAVADRHDVGGIAAFEGDAGVLHLRAHATPVARGVFAIEPLAHRLLGQRRSRHASQQQGTDTCRKSHTHSPSLSLPAAAAPMRPEATGDSNPSSPFRNDECVALSALPAKQRYNVAMQHPKPNRHSVDCGRRHCGFSAGMAGPAVHAINGRLPASAGPVDRHIAITMARTPMQLMPILPARPGGRSFFTATDASLHHPQRCTDA